MASRIRADFVRNRPTILKAFSVFHRTLAKKPFTQGDSNNGI